MKRTMWTSLWTAVMVVAIPAQAQVPPDCPNTCHHTYALCIAASCDQDGRCGDCDKNDGSCGYCYVFQGKSCSFGKQCQDLKPSGNIVYSTYSEVLASTYDFKVMTCPNPQATADCMDAQCTLTGHAVQLQGEDIPTAICSCRIAAYPGGGTLGGDCNSQNCSAIWSTAGSVLNSQPQCPSSG